MKSAISLDLLRHFEWADVFCLPTLSEGSATVTYEALASGVPVICTPNAGSVVREGIDGFLVPIRDAEGIAERLASLEANRQMLAEMANSARQRANEYSWQSYGERLVRALSTCVDRPDKMSTRSSAE